MLYLVSTPIGNLKDITFRAVETLKSVDLIAAEDTRHTGILLKHYGIDTLQISYHEHNAARRSEELLARMQAGARIALVSDAGTPGISDPGYRLIRLARDHGIAVTSVPGACAAVAALSVSGLPSDRFCFEGFLPAKTAARRKRLEALQGDTRTLIFYESPHRVVKCLKDIEEVLADPFVVVARELTKTFEETVSGPASEIFLRFSAGKPRGEFVILVKGADRFSEKNVSTP